MRSLCLLTALTILIAGCASSGPQQAAGGTDGASDASHAGAGSGNDATHDPGTEGDGDGQGAAPRSTRNGTGDGNASAPDAGGNQTGTADNGTADPDGGTDPAGGDATADGNGTADGDGNSTDSGGGTTGNGTSSSGGNGTSDGSTQDGGSSDPDGGSGEDPEPETRWLDVGVTDATDNLVDSPQNVTVSVTDYGTWHADPPTYGSTQTEGMGQHEVGKLHEDGFIVHVNGGETVCAVDMQVTAEMDNSLDWDAWVDVNNVDVWIYGPAIPGYPDSNSPYICPR